jgi:hypothetical protein
VVFNWPLALAVLHNAGAALMVVLLTMLNCRVAAGSPVVDKPIHAPVLTA